MPRCRCLDQAEHRVGDDHELAELGEVAADEREVMVVVEMADLADPLEAFRVAELAASA